MDFIKKNFVFLLLIGLSLVIINNYRGRLNTANSRALNYSDSLSYYKLKNGATIASKMIMEVNNKELEKALNNSTKEIKELQDKFSKIESKTSLISKIELDTIIVEYKDTLLLSQEGFYNDNYYSFYYKTAKEDFKIASMTIYDTTTLISGYKRKWFLGPTTHYIDVHHSNPFVKEIGISSLQLKEDKKWYQTSSFKIGVGILGGFILAKQL